jgi:hypothetical protein
MTICRWGFQGLALMALVSSCWQFSTPRSSNYATNTGARACWAAYLGQVSFPSYVIADAPVEPDMFAYLAMRTERRLLAEQR